MLNRHLILSTLIIGLIVGMLGSIYDPNLMVFAQKEEKNHVKNSLSIEIMDRELKHVNDKFVEIKDEIKSIHKKIDTICEDVTSVRIKSAESGGIYGGGASVVVYFCGLLIKGLWDRRKNGKK
jgi:peptidoglycan hydrolase CwlO-like protein